MRRKNARDSTGFQRSGSSGISVGWQDLRPALNPLGWPVMEEMQNTSPLFSTTHGDEDRPTNPTERAEQQHEEALTQQALAESQAEGHAEQPHFPDQSCPWDGEADSAIGSDASFVSSTMSLRPSIYEPVQEFGRTYHSYKSGKYNLPNDEKEQDRLDLQHAMFTQLIGNRLSAAPIDTIPLHNVLDIATGTGLWAIEFADAHPSAHILGTDISPIQPLHVPPNCTFEVDDAEDEWLFNKSFSYIHGRAIVTCFKDPLFVIRSAYDALTPGGILEYQDPVFPLLFADPHPPEDSPFVRWQKLIVESGNKAGRPWTVAPQYKEWFEQAGFVDVHVEKFFFPTGPWHEDKRLRRIGAWQLENWLEAIEAISPRMLNRLGWEIEEIKVLVAQVRDEFLKGLVKPYCDFLCVWGRKPESKD